MLFDTRVSSREAEVLTAIGEHLTNAEIAARLFISVRTVESHVSSLLRKFGVGDRRALAQAAARPVQPPAEPATHLPTPLTSFVGRVAEREALAEALEAQRLVTAVGPGGVGKTRLALSVAAEVADRFPDGVWFIDLAPVTDPAAIPCAVARALGLGERQDQSVEDTVLSWLTDREALLLFDNCEHLADGLVAVLERLLEAGRRLRVLATSRARLLVPFEWVFPVPGLSLDADDGGPGDAVRLFVERAASGGAPLTPDDSARIAGVCRAVDGVALAIELAAARYPSLGLDGLEAALADQLRLLTGPPRSEPRHRSLRSTLDWSCELLDPADEAVLRRVSVFAAPFTAAAAEAMLGGWAPLPEDGIAASLARLADQSLLVATASPHGMRYRVAETIRQYGAERLAEAGEALDAHVRHLGWCLDVAATLGDGAADTAKWRALFDQVADELRAALCWSSSTRQHRAEAHRLALRLADLCFARGLPGESQRRYEQAATLVADPAAAAAALRSAAGAAESRHFGNDALRLRMAAAQAAKSAGDAAGAAGDLARTAELINRGPGIMAWPPDVGDVEALLDEARALAAGSPIAQARVLIAELYARDETDPCTAVLAERALVLAGDVGDPLLQSSALDELTSIHLARGEVRAARARALRRTALLARTPVVPASGFEISDAYSMAAECAVAAGDLEAAREFAEHVRDLPFHREEGHLATARLIVVAMMQGHWDEAVTLSERFREGWDRAGRPRAGNLTRGAYAAATVHGLRGDDEARAAWLATADALTSPSCPISEIHFGEFFDAGLLLHRGRPDQALDHLRTPPEDFRSWYTGMWRPWYAALWAEAAVLAGCDEAPARVERARRATRDNPVAAAVVERAAAMLAGDRDGLLRAAADLRAAGCRYQWARTLVMLGGRYLHEGEAALAAMGATPMWVTDVTPALVTAGPR